MRDRFLAALLESLGVDPAAVRSPGVTVAGHERRAESHVTAGYVINDHFVISCDPAGEAMLTAATAAMAPTLDAWKQAAVDTGGKFLGSGRMQLLGPQLPTVDVLPPGLTRRTLHGEDSDDLTLIEGLIDVSDTDDLDEAEIALDDLDEIIEVVLDGDGQIVAYSAARPFDLAAEFGDIGIMTRRDHRGRGLGSHLVAALCRRLRESGHEPLYRCDEDNLGSVKLSHGLGFEIATQLAGYRFPDL